LNEDCIGFSLCPALDGDHTTAWATITNYNCIPKKKKKEKENTHYIFIQATKKVKKTSFSLKKRKFIRVFPINTKQQSRNGIVVNLDKKAKKRTT